MEDGVLSPATMLRSSTAAMDFDYMDELLLQGCWLETTDGSEFFNPIPASPFFDPSFTWPASESDNGDSNSSPLQKSIQEVNKQMSPLLSNSPRNELQSRSLANAQFFVQNVASFAARDSTECSDINRRWWIGPRGDQGPGTSVRDRLVRALDYIQEYAKAKDVLIQLWVPINRGGRCVLTTQGQPFAVDSSCPRLARYRDISENYQFSAEKDSNGLMGLPGRVFLGKVPEWTPDVRFFRSDEYLRVDHAQQYDVRGTLALPVFEQGSRTCLGVIEVVTTKKTIKYRPELESVCKALEAVDLRSSEVISPRNVKPCDVTYETALPEILNVLKSACETHQLPLAQTWIPCVQQGKGGCRHSDENYFRCVSTVDNACYVKDPTIQGFHEACSEHHLLKGQGVAGGALMTNQPCFSSDITSTGKTEYPLSHHAKMFGLRAAVAIRLRSVHTGTADFVLEFFLPVECIDSEEQKKMLDSLSVIIRQVCQTLRVVTDEELMEEVDIPVSEVTLPADVRTSQEEKSKVQNSSPERQNEEAYYKGRIERNEDSTTFLEGSYSSICTSKSGEKKRPKAEKTITLQVLRQYFAGSLKDAAKNIGVCPTTLKRICRQHGIMRWPSRKIKKVGHSLQKLQHVIDSVQGAPGALQIGSFYANFPELASSNLSGTSTFSTSTPSDHPKLPHIHHEEGVFNSQALAPKSPSSSFSQSSSSSQCCSSGMQNTSSTFNAVVNEDVPRENPEISTMKRVKSTAELHNSSPGPGEKPIARSHSHRSLKELAANSGNPPPLPKSSTHISQEVDSHRVKVSYGNKNIRFRMPNSWGFKDLAQEIARRFNIDDINAIELKYLDDDSEWVLLTCDDDLEECIDVCTSSQNATIKLSLQVSHLLSSFGSTSP